MNSELGRAVVRPILLVAFILVQIHLIFFLRHDTLDLEVWPNTNPSPRVFGSQTVGQTFIPQRDGLNRIDVLLGTHGLDLKHDLILRLYEGKPAGRPVAEIRVPGPSIRNNLFHPFEFKPIRRSKGRSFTFILAVPSAAEKESPSVWMTASDLFPGGTILINERPENGDCVFRTYSRRTIISEWDRISHGVPGRWGNPWLLAMIALLFEVAIVIAFWRIIGLFLKEERKPDA